MTMIRRWLSSSSRWLAVPPILIGVGVVAALASSRKELPRLEATRVATPVEVVAVATHMVFPEILGFGTASARRTWTATAEVAGKVVATHPTLRSGRRVEAGATLLQIDREDYQLRVDQRVAELEQAQSQLAERELAVESDQASLAIQQQLLKVLENDVSRLGQLRERSAASPSELDSKMSAMLQQKQGVQNLLNTLRTSPSQIAAAEASVRLASLRVAEAKRELAKTTILAPFGGVLSDVSIEPSQYVGPNQALFEILDTDALEVEGQFSIEQLDRVVRPREVETSPTDFVQPNGRIQDPAQSGQDESAGLASYDLREEPVGLSRSLTADVTIRSGGVQMNFVAKPYRFTESLDQETRTLGVVVRVDDHSSFTFAGESLLKPGTYCEIRLRSRHPFPAIEVPRTSLDDGHVFVVDSNNTVRRRRVDVAFMFQNRVAIASGLGGGDLVVARPSPALRDGDLVNPKPIDVLGESQRD
ncbi:MAG: HlyD family efflux transporter periplasmic adaptor subunit [Planctomycetota bacterium]